MNKHIALVSGTIFLLTIILVPLTGAFAYFDTSVALPQFVFSLMFSSVSIGSTIDVTNYNAATGTSSTDSSVHLYNTAGSYSQINRQGINIAQNLLCLRYTIDNPSSGFFDDLIIEPYINGSPAHLYGTYTQSDNNNSITYYMFFYIGADTIRVKDSQGQDITPWGIRFTRTHDISYSWSFSSSSTSMYYYNYTLQSQTVDPGEAAELALDIINVLQLSQLSENLGMINNQLDTGNIASMMESMLTYLAQIPDIIQYIDQLETTDNNILSGITTFLNYYTNQTQLNYSTLSSSLYSCYVIRNGQTIYNGNTSDLTSPLSLTYGDIVTFCCIIPSSSIGNFYTVRLPVGCDRAVVDLKCKAKYYLNNSQSYRPALIDHDCIIEYYNDSTLVYIPYCFASSYTRLWISLYIDYNTYTSPTGYAPSLRALTTSNYFVRLYNSNQASYLERILLYIEQLFFSNNQVPADVQNTTDDINQNATTVNTFQSNTQQSLDQNLNDVPVVDYQIQATTGTQYMKAYSEALFNASNGFRIWYMLPLILFVIGMLIRWGIKK